LEEANKNSLKERENIISWTKSLSILDTKNLTIKKRFKNNIRKN